MVVVWMSLTLAWLPAQQSLPCAPTEYTAGSAARVDGHPGAHGNPGAPNQPSLHRMPPSVPMSDHTHPLHTMPLANVGSAACFAGRTSSQPPSSVSQQRLPPAVATDGGARGDSSDQGRRMPHVHRPLPSEQQRGAAQVVTTGTSSGHNPAAGVFKWQKGPGSDFLSFLCCLLDRSLDWTVERTTGQSIRDG